MPQTPSPYLDAVRDEERPSRRNTSSGGGTCRMPRSSSTGHLQSASKTPLAFAAAEDQVCNVASELPCLPSSYDAFR